MQIDDPLENAEDVPGAQSLTRGIDLLLLLGRSSPLTFRQIQDHLGLSKGSLHRLLSALRSRRLVRYDRDTRRYAIGATVMSLARGALDRDSTVRACQAEMSRLSQLLKVPCCLYVSDDDSVFVLDAADPAGRTVRVWPRLTLESSTPGQAMLAGRPAGQKNEWSADLQRILSKARALGYVASDGDPLAVAAPVLDGEGTVVGALCCQFDAAGTRPDRLHEAGQMIREAARRASHHVGVTQKLNEQVIAPRPKTGFKGKVHDTGRDYVGESPSWCESTGRLWWLDVLAPALRWLDVETGASGRSLLDGLTGGLALTTGAELLLTGENGLSLFDPASGQQTPLIDPEAHRPENRFNTVGVDPEQRLWTGTMPLDNLEKSGTLYRIHPDLTTEIIQPEIFLPKNTAFSRGGRHAYLTEQDPAEGRAVLMSYELDEDGLPLSRRALLEGSDAEGQPAGLTIDAEDCLWVAMRGGWSVLRLDPEGRELARHALPVPMPTALTFGGPDLGSLFVTSTYLRLPPGYNDIAPLSGRLIELRPGVTGRAPTRVKLERPLMTDYTFTPRHEALALTGEVPLWDATRDCLWWLDIQGQRLLSHQPGGKNSAIPLPGQCGLIALAESGRLVLGLEDGLVALDPEAMVWERISDTEADAPERRLNDGKPDRQGRLWFGSMDVSGKGVPSGGLFRRDRDGRIEKVLSDIAIPNAIVGDPQADAIWFTDTPTRRLERFDLDADGGIARRSTLLTLPEGSHPDGMSMDGEGKLWLALVGPGEVIRIDPASGEICHRLSLPVHRPTMAIWSDRSLFVTSQRRFLDAKALAQQPLAGQLIGADGSCGTGPTMRVAGV